MELEILEPIANAFRHRVPLFANRLRHQYAEAQRAVAEDHLAWLDHVLADRPFIAGDHFSVAHIIAFWGVDFGRVSGISVKPDQANLLRWFEAVARRLAPRLDARGSTLSKWTQLGVQLTISAQKQRANQGGLIGSQASGLHPKVGDPASASEQARRRADPIDDPTTGSTVEGAGG